MSGLVTGLSIGGAIAGAIAGPAYVILESIGDFWSRSSTPDRSLAKWSVGGAIVGTALLGGGGYIYENGISSIFSNANAPATAPVDPPNCIKNAPKNYSITINKDGSCIYAPKP